MSDWRENGEADSREGAKSAKTSVGKENLRAFASSRDDGKADSREAAKSAKKSVGKENLRVFASSREGKKANSREAAKDAKNSETVESEAIDGGLDELDAAGDTKCRLKEENLRAFASSREMEGVGSREAAKDAKKSVGEGNLRAFASSRETNAAATSERLNVEALSAVVVNCAYKLHVEVGPGLLESVYEAVLARMIQQRGVPVRRQVAVPVRLMGMRFEEGFRADLLVDEHLVVELKSVERMMPVHAKQLLTYLRLLHLPLGLLINFGAPTFKEGIKRIVNRHVDFASSRLRVNRNSMAGNPP